MYVGFLFKAIGPKYFPLTNVNKIPQRKCLQCKMYRLPLGLQTLCSRKSGAALALAELEGTEGGRLARVC